jgi:hypothetical protein
MNPTERWANKAISVAEYLDGWEVRAPAIPGCVVRLRDGEKAMSMVRECVIAVHGEPPAKATDVSDEIPWWSTTA